MKTLQRMLGLLLVVGAGGLWVARAQDGIETTAGFADIHVRQLTAEKEALQEMLNDGNTSADRKAEIKRLLEWNAHGMTIAEVKLMEKLSPGKQSTTPAITVTPRAEARPAVAAPAAAPVAPPVVPPPPAPVIAAPVSKVHLIKPLPPDTAAPKSAPSASSATSLPPAGSNPVLSESMVKSVHKILQASGKAPESTPDATSSDVATPPPAAPVARDAIAQIGGGGQVPVVPPTEAIRPVATALQKEDHALDIGAFRSTSQRFVPRPEVKSGKADLPKYSTFEKKFPTSLETPPAVPPPAATLPEEAKPVTAAPAVTPPPPASPVSEPQLLKPPIATSRKSGEDQFKFWVRSCPQHGRYVGSDPAAGCPKCEQRGR